MSTTPTYGIADPSRKVAIIGIGCRLPGGISSPAQLRDYLELGKEASIEVPAERWSLERYYSADASLPGRSYVSRGGFVHQSPFDFDPEPFGISPREAERLDPQQRWLLEVTLEAFEDAGIPTSSLRASRTAVYVGGFTQDHQTLMYAEENRPLIDAHTAVGTSMTVLSNRISYTFDLRGPSVTVDTACSGSLVAVHLARQAILYEDCPMAIAGGVNVMLSPMTTIAMSKGHFLAPDGRSKAFDAAADGYGRAEGAAVVILKRLDLALRDGNQIYAVIHGSGTGQDGRTDGMPMPSGDAQRSLIESVLAQSSIRSCDVGYVEAHGTGTRIGDPTEAAAIGAVYGRERKSPLRIGSLKSNLGHLEACAGVTGLIKATLAVRDRAIIPQRLTGVLNPEIPFAHLGLEVATRPEVWPLEGPAIAAVNAFGYGGTNAHVIVGEWATNASVDLDAKHRACATADQDGQGNLVCVPISAASRPSMRAFAAEMAKGLDDSAWLNQVSTLAHHRTHHVERAVIVAASASELRESLVSLAAGTCDERTVQQSSRPERRLLWVFTGMGPQWWAMGRRLYASNCIYRDALNEVDEYFQAATGHSIVEQMQADEGSSRMRRNDVAQPANFALQVGLVQVLRAAGVPCHGILGHSVGEVVSAWAAGCLSLRDATQVAAHRSQLQQTIAGQGTMVAVGAGLLRMQTVLSAFQDVEIAAVNSPNMVTVAGAKPALQRLTSYLDEEKIFNRWVSVEVPYHSSAMQPLREAFLSRLAWLTPARPELPLYSTVRGAAMEHGGFDANYFWQNARQPVLLNDALGAAVGDGFNTFLEIGPHPVLAASIQEVLASKDRTGEVFCCQRRNTADELVLARAIASMHACGIPLDWTKTVPTLRPAPVPSYAFARTRHWVESQAARERRVGRPNAQALLAHRDNGPSPRFVVDLASPGFSYLADHRIAGKVVVPAAFYVAMALEYVAEIAAPRVPIQVEALEFERVLVVQPADPGDLVMDVEGERTVVRFYHRRAGEDWSRHATLRLANGLEHAQPPVADLAKLLLEHRVPVNLAGLYDQFARLGLNYGAQFRGLQEVWTDDEETGGSVLARLRCSSQPKSDGAIDPQVIDAAFQAVLALAKESDCAAVPYRIESVVVFPAALRAEWVKATARVGTDGSVTADLELMDSQGAVSCKIRGLFCRPVESEQERDRALLPLYHDEEWIERQWPLELQPVSRAIALAGAESQAGQRLAAVLTAQGFLVSRLGSEQLNVPGSPILYFTEAEPQEDCGIQQCAELAQLTNRLRQKPADLTIVTIGAQRVTPGDCPQPHQAALWGFGRVIMTEHPELHCRLIDLESSSDLAFAQLCRLLAAPNLEEETGVRRERVLHRSIVRRGPLALETTPQRPAWKPGWRKERTILVTGGLTGFGLATAKWLVERGAECLVLASRRGTPDAAAAAIVDRLRRHARIECKSVDVSSATSVANLLAEIATDMPPLGGVFHSAMVLDDEPIRDLSPAALQSVMRPKALGAWLLHDQTKHLELDYFVTYSSVSALVGNPSQASYAAANAYLQALAESRAAQGLAATCISWGALGDTGVVARDAALEAHLRSLGLTPIAPRTALRALRYALEFGVPHVGIIDANWSRWVANFPNTPWNRLSVLLEAESAQAQPHLGQKTQLAVLDGAALRAELFQRILQATASVLRIEAASIKPESKLNHCGLDSLMAAELGRSIEAATGVVVATMELLANVSVQDLVEICGQRITGPSTPGSLELAQDASVRGPSNSGTFAVAPRLRDHLLSRICVQPPYFDLDDIARDGEWLIAGVAPLGPTAHERDTVSCAEVSRHLAILGSCAVSLNYPQEGRVYYPVIRAHRPKLLSRREASLGEMPVSALSTVTMRARCTHLDLGASRATAEAIMYDANGLADQVLEVEYHLIPEPQFQSLFERYRKPTNATPERNPYASWSELPMANRVGDDFILEFSAVSSDQCLGHFANYPALPLSLMMRDAVRLVTQGVRGLSGWSQAQVTVVQGGVVAHAFAFAGESLQITAHRLERSVGTLTERWLCRLTSAGRAIADIELELQICPNLAVTAYPGPAVPTALTA